jgi:hypothetical protein
MSAFPLNTQNIINIQTDIEGLEDGIKRLSDLESDLFGSTSAA